MILDSISKFLEGESSAKVSIGVDHRAMIKIAIIAVVAVLLTVVLIRVTR